MTHWTERIRSMLASPWFFRLVLVLLVLQALWLALSALYPMAFDERYHFTYIQLFAQQWSPLITTQPDGFDHLGAVTRDTSQLYHYLMSFPYRLVAAFTADQTVQIITLRFINIGLFVAGVALFRRVMFRAGLTPALTHLGILLFTLIPIVPLLAGQINYDNAVLPLVAGMFLLSHRVITGFRNGYIPMQPILWLAVIVAVTGLVKIAALPIIAIVVIYVLTSGFQAFRRQPELRSSLASAWHGAARSSLISALLLLLVFGGLFAERYAGNLVMHQTILPSCDQIIDRQQCLGFEPFQRNIRYREEVSPAFEPSRLEHTRKWTVGMWHRTFYMINGDVPADTYQSYPAPPLLMLGSIVVLLAGVGATVRYGRQLFVRRPYLQLFAVSSLFYIATIWWRNFDLYAEQGRVAGSNGRYLLLIALPVIAILAMALQRALAGRERTKLAVAGIILLLFLQGGGVLSFMLRSNDNWYWPHPLAQKANQTAQQLISPVIFGEDWEYMHRFLY